MIIRYLGIFLLGFLLFSCGTPPAGWEGGGNGGGNGDGDGNGDGNGVVYGCTDPEALNYNSEATEDDGSCDYYDPCGYLTDAYSIAYTEYLSSYDYYIGYNYNLCLAMAAAYLAALNAGCAGFTLSDYNNISCY